MIGQFFVTCQQKVIYISGEFTASVFRIIRVKATSSSERFVTYVQVLTASYP